MDGRRFDHLTVQLERMVSRRRAGALLAALGLGIGFGLGEDAEARRKKKKGKKKKPGNGSPAPTCSGPPPCAAGCRDCGTVCIAEREDACCTQDDCGGFSFTDLVCAGNRCICNPNGKAGWGICQRFGDGSGLCGPCCPGATVGDVCEGDTVCVNQSIQGCGCPEPLAACQGTARCSTDVLTDSRRCGASCIDCTNTGETCCPSADPNPVGQCRNLRGCGPNFGSSECFFGPCGTCDTFCDPGFICCNRGGPTGECVQAAGGACPGLA